MSGWLKRLRRKLRNRKPALLLASILIVLVLSAGITSYYFAEQTDSMDANNEAQVVLSPQKWNVVIQKKYLVGPMVIEQGLYSTSELDQLIASLANVAIIEESEDTIVYEQMIEDLSPILKANGYFAMDPKGVLHLYQGGAKEEHNIIQTFFQIDIERLETTLPVEEYMQLREGIPFTSLAEYNSILSTYSEYAVFTDEAEPIEEY